MSRWVQHISGQGEKWEVVEFSLKRYQVVVRSSRERNAHHSLPTSEYVICDPPEEWEDVTRVYTATHLALTYQCEPTDKITKIDGMHHGPAFIIERRKA